MSISKLYTAEVMRRHKKKGEKMKSCCNAHDEILFYGGDCPVCQRDQEIFDLDKRIAEFISKIISMKMEMQKTDKILETLKEGIAAYGGKK